MCRINGKKLANFRTENGMTQAQLAKKLGMTASTIYNYESGKSTPSDEVVEKICMLLRINKDEVEIKNVDYDFKSGSNSIIDHARKVWKDNRHRTPVDTEEYISKRRKADETEEKEIVEIESKLEQPVSFAGKTYIQIKPVYIHVPNWQRNTDFAKAEVIARQYDPNKYDPVKVYRNNGKLYVSDGAHRVVAAVMRNELIKKDLMIIVEILDCNEEEARKIFLYQKAGRKDMTVSDMYRAAIGNKEVDYMKLKEICESNNIQITAEENLIENPIGKLTPSRSALRLANANNNIMQTAIGLMKDLGWTGSQKNAFTMRNFHVLRKLLANYGSDVERQLLVNCKGAAFYEAKVAPVKSDAELYDILSSEINK